MLARIASAACHARYASSRAKNLLRRRTNDTGELTALEHSCRRRVDIKPEKQKTVPDFVATKLLFGIDSVCVTDIVKEGRRLFRRKDGKLVPIPVNIDTVNKLLSTHINNEKEMKQWLAEKFQVFLEPVQVL